MSNWVRMIKPSQTIKDGPQTTHKEPTDSATKRFGQVQEPLDHKEECTTVQPELSLKKLNNVTSCATTTVRKAKKSWSKGGFLLS